VRTQTVDINQLFGHLYKKVTKLFAYTEK